MLDCPYSVICARGNARSYLRLYSFTSLDPDKAFQMMNTGQHNSARQTCCAGFHEDRKINVASRVLTRKNAPPPGGHVFQPISIIFEIVQDIIGMNLMTKFHEDWTINVASRVHISHVFQAKVTIFEIIQDIIETNLLTKFHEDWTINVASRELTRQMLHRTTHNGQKAITKAHHEHIVLR
ncbi:hypothetical protein DPMN_127803 [Dreissena polymorpha]|uniref:Uncharacterized protein n=1 Tax=Dreissena polymorpha TaxID=45954 RepID=A0A9D4H5Y4_DREPO|nr:hypothetical protein DPMN_127803 [Dreissena polymorpha]